MNPGGPGDAAAGLPVVLVPGWSDTARSLRRARDFLIAEGVPAVHVECVEFRDRYGCNIEHADELAAAIDALCHRTGAAQVAAVAHSMGGLAVREYLARHGSAHVSTAVFVGTPHQGTWMSWLGWGTGARQMRPGSEFLRRLNARPLPRDVTAHCIRTPLDARILPGSSAWLPGATCHVVRAPTHAALMRHRRTLRLVRRLIFPLYYPDARTSGPAR